MTSNLICINTNFQFVQNKNKIIEFQSYLFVNPRSRDGVRIMRFGVRIDPDRLQSPELELRRDFANPKKK